MKFSTCFAAALFTLSAGAYAQTSQTFHFGEGESGVSHGAPAPKPAHKAGTHKAKHQERHHGHSTQPDSYSHN